MADGQPAATGEWSLAAVHDVIAAAVPHREMLVGESVRRTFGEVAQRTRGLAMFLAERGLGINRERRELERWESGQDAVALVLHNCPEYIEAMLASYRARAVPFNVNQHYRPKEVADLFATIRPRAVVYHRRFGPLIEAAGANRAGLVLIDVDDGSGETPLPQSTEFEKAVSTSGGSLPDPSPDDLYMVCTGGTTGLPKAVLWRQADIFVSAMAGAEGLTPEAIAATSVANKAGPWFPVPPLMHAAAQWTAFCGLHGGAPVVLHDDSGPFDARRVLELIERERVSVISIVGDAFARPLVEELRRGGYDLGSLERVGTGGAMTAEHLKAAIIEQVPHVMVLDGYGASETGGMAYGANTAQFTSDAFDPAAGATVVSEDRTRFLAPGDDEVGWTARRGRVPLGYLADRGRTEKTFPVIDGERVAIPGDRARYSSEGRIILLGRDAMVVNSGGEKIFVEEVEAVLRTHPDVDDAVVVGRPSERFGQEVVALVAPRRAATLNPEVLRSFVAAEIARFKAPRAVAVVDLVRRHANGKPDYEWAQEQAAAAVDVAGDR